MTKPTPAKLPLSFPKRFLWGVSTAAHQIEGRTHNQWTVWELENAKSLAHQARYKLDELPIWDDIEQQATDPNNYVSGHASDHYRQYAKDLAVVEAMGLNAFRFSIEWSRLEPQEGKWDQAAVDYYRSYIKTLKKRGIEPIVTLMHWTLPVWFADKGGFERSSNLVYFVRFAEKVIDEFASDLRYIITINEPETYMSKGWLHGEWPPAKINRYAALKVYRNLAIAHRKIYRLAHQKNRRLKVGLSKSIIHYSRDDDSKKTRFAVYMAQQSSEYWFLNSINRKVDWLGINYYVTRHYKAGKCVANDAAPLNDLGWEMEPQNLQFVLERVYKKYKKPLIITENGIADMHDKYRKWWLGQTLLAMSRAIRRGVKLEGYLHHGLLDSFEWSYGHWPRFGLLAVDYATQKRKPRASAIWFAKGVKRLRGKTSDRG